MKRTSKKSQAVSFLIAAGLTFTVFTTAYAYLTDHGTMKNVFTIGNVEHKTDENFTPPRKLEKETSFKKEVKIKNTGEVPAFIRVYVGFTDGFVEDRSMVSADPVSKADADKTYFTPETKDITIEYTNDDETSKETVTYTPYYKSDALKALGWVYDDSGDPDLGGWYYYTKAVPAGESTDYLFRTVKTVFQKKDDIRPYSINVYSESVQALDFDGNPYSDSDYKKAWEEYIKDKSAD